MDAQSWLPPPPATARIPKLPPWPTAKGWFSAVPLSLEPRVRLRIREFATSSPDRTLAAPTGDEVHIWYANTACGIPDGLDRYLSDEENNRAQRFRFQEHRSHFIFSHAVLRLLIGAYRAVPPHDVSFNYGSHGKPSIANEQYPQNLAFNMSHTEGIVVCAFATGRQIGVDVEHVRKDFDVAQIAERFFSIAERNALRDLADGAKHEAFFCCWTRKEAYIKALGEGLSHPLHQFDVCIEERPNLLLATRPDVDEVNRWVICNVPLPAPYVGAVAYDMAGDSGQSAKIDY